MASRKEKNGDGNFLFHDIFKQIKDENELREIFSGRQLDWALMG
jgi:hypothetical protein